MNSSTLNCNKKIIMKNPVCFSIYETTLTFIYFHLWPNAYNDLHTPFAKQMLENGFTAFYYSKEKDKGYIDRLDFKVDGQTVKWEYDSQHIDICKILLNQPLKSGQTITITTPFHIKILWVHFQEWAISISNTRLPNGIRNRQYTMAMAGTRCPTSTRENFILSTAHSMYTLLFRKIT